MTWCKFSNHISVRFELMVYVYESWIKIMIHCRWWHRGHHDGGSTPEPGVSCHWSALQGRPREVVRPEHSLGPESLPLPFKRRIHKEIREEPHLSQCQLELQTTEKSSGILQQRQNSMPHQSSLNMSWRQVQATHHSHQWVLEPLWLWPALEQLHWKCCYTYNIKCTSENPRKFFYLYNIHYSNK